jgi:hydroxypyruvate reductase
LTMAAGVPAHVRLTDGLAIAPDAGDVPGFEVVVSSHPFADERSIVAAQRARNFVDAVPADAVLLVLISGGTSALLAEPRGVSLAGKRAVVDAVMAAGAPIAALNTVRTALSSIKGGGLLRNCRAPVMTWAISDVPGDDIAVIGSGPTIARAGAELAGQAIAARYGVPWPPVDIAPALPPRPQDHAAVIAPRAALADAIAALVPNTRRASLDGDMPEIAARLAEQYTQLLPGGWLLAAGEPTLALPPHAGPGGRMRDLALRLAILLDGQPFAALCVASDGADGVGAPLIAGAFVDGSTARRGRAATLDLPAASAIAGSAAIWHALGDELLLGHTGANYADVVLLQRNATSLA